MARDFKPMTNAKPKEMRITFGAEMKTALTTLAKYQDIILFADLNLGTTSARLLSPSSSINCFREQVSHKWTAKKR